MTILAENLKTIRKHLNCTQMALAEVLEIGFRTFVRYEAGERDAPVSVLVKLSKLGNIGLDRLLTTKISPEDLSIPDMDSPTNSHGKQEVIGGSIEEGRLTFKGIKDDYFVSTREPEKKLLTLYRKMPPLVREQFLLDIEWMMKNSQKNKKGARTKKVSKKFAKAKNAEKLKKISKSIRKITLKG